MGIEDLDLHGDSQFVINQLLEEYEVKKKDLVSYHTQARQILERLDTVKLQHVPRSVNKMDDALTNLAATLALGAKEDMTIPVCGKWVVTPSEEEFAQEINAFSVYEVHKEDWRQLLIDYLGHRKLPNDVRHKTKIQMRAPHFLYYNDTLYRHSFFGLRMRCLGEEEAQQVVKEAHSGVCGAHQSRPKLYDRIKRMGYY